MKTCRFSSVVKLRNFIFLIFAQNIDCGYTPVLLNIKVGYQSVYIIWTCYLDVYRCNYHKSIISMSQWTLGI